MLEKQEENNVLTWLVGMIKNRKNKVLGLVNSWGAMEMFIGRGKV